jgi:hypothetical protein
MASLFLDSYTSKPTSVTPYSHPEYKFCLDDALTRLLCDDLHYTPTNTLGDVKMLLGYIASAFAAYGSYESYTKPFHSSGVMDTLYLCVPMFFLFQGAMLAWSSFVEGDIVFAGVKKDVVGAGGDVSVSVATKFVFPRDKIEICIETVCGKKKGGKTVVVESVGKWFNKEGLFIARDFKVCVWGLMCSVTLNSA